MPHMDPCEVLGGGKRLGPEARANFVMFLRTLPPLSLELVMRCDFAVRHEVCIVHPFKKMKSRRRVISVRTARKPPLFPFVSNSETKAWDPGNLRHKPFERPCSGGSIVLFRRHRARAKHGIVQHTLTTTAHNQWPEWAVTGKLNSS